MFPIQSVFSSLLNFWGFKPKHADALKPLFLQCFPLLKVQPFETWFFTISGFKNGWRDALQKITLINFLNWTCGQNFDTHNQNLHFWSSGMPICIGFLKLGHESNFHLAIRIALEWPKVGHQSNSTTYMWVSSQAFACLCFLRRIVLVLNPSKRKPGKHCLNQIWVTNVCPLVAVRWKSSITAVWSCLFPPKRPEIAERRGFRLVCLYLASFSVFLLVWLSFFSVFLLSRFVWVFLCNTEGSGCMAHMDIAIGKDGERSMDRESRSLPLTTPYNPTTTMDNDKKPPRSKTSKVNRKERGRGGGERRFVFMPKMGCLTVSHRGRSIQPYGKRGPLVAEKSTAIHKNMTDI